MQIVSALINDILKSCMWSTMSGLRSSIRLLQSHQVIFMPTYFLLCYLLLNDKIINNYNFYLKIIKLFYFWTAIDYLSY